MTATAMSLPSTSAAVERRPGVLAAYGRFWRRMPRGLGYLAVTAVIGFLSLTIFRTAESIGAGLLAILVGLIIFALILVAARYLGAFELYRLRLARCPASSRPPGRRPSPASPSSAHSATWSPTRTTGCTTCTAAC